MEETMSYEFKPGYVVYLGDRFLIQERTYEVVRFDVKSGIVTVKQLYGLLAGRERRFTAQLFVELAR